MVKSALILLALCATTLALPRPYSSKGFGLPGRIVGGTVVSKNELPYQLSLRYGGSHICGASILNANWAITAAHCAVVGSASSFSISAGDHTLNVNDGTEQTSSVSKVTVHQSYNANTFTNDIALMKLSTPLTLNNYVKAVTIPAASYAASGNAIVSGWGTTEKFGRNFGTKEISYFIYVIFIFMVF